MVPKPFKAAVGALAAMATLAMGFTGTAMAADTRIDAAKLAVAQPITVTSNMDISGKNLVAVQLAKYSYAQTDGTNITGFDLVDSGKNTAVANALRNAGINTSTTKSGAYAYNANNPMIWVVQNLLDSTNSPWTGQLRNFLNKLNHESVITGDAGVKLAKGANANTMTASVTPGVYAIIDRTTTGQASIVMFNGTGIDGKTTLKNGNTNYTLGTVSYKTHGTTVSKKITATSRGTIEGNGATAETSIGKTVSFELTSQVPNWTGFDKYYYALNDTYSAGLTFDPSTVKVNVNGTDLVNDSSHTYWKVTTESGKFHVIFAPTADANAAGTASDIVAMAASYPIQTAVKVTYTMTVNKNAVPQTADTNTVNVEYSRNPNTVTDHTGLLHACVGQARGLGPPVPPHPEDSLQVRTVRNHGFGHAVHHLPLVFGDGARVMAHHDLLGGIAYAVHRLADRAAVLHEQGRVGHPQRAERGVFAARELPRLAEMVAQRGGRKDGTLSALEHVRARLVGPPGDVLSDQRRQHARKRAYAA